LEVAAEHSIDRTAARRAVATLVGEGWVARARRDLYVYLDPFTKEQRAHPFLVGTRVSEPSAISHWSALQHWALTDQLPDAVTVSVVRQVKPPSENQSSTRGAHRRWQLANTEYEFIQIRPTRMFGITAEWFGRWKIPLFDRERTLLDCFLQPDYFGSISIGLGVVESNVEQLDLGKLVDYALKVRSVHTVKRLGWALERAGVKSGPVTKLLDYPIAPATRVLLEPSAARRGRLDPRWHVLVNQ
jgi:predicted transcriptional regulator of viral defense system